MLEALEAKNCRKGCRRSWPPFEVFRRSLAAGGAAGTVYVFPVSHTPLRPTRILSRVSRNLVNRAQPIRKSQSELRQ